MSCQVTSRPDKYGHHSLQLLANTSTFTGTRLFLFSAPHCEVYAHFHMAMMLLRRFLFKTLDILIAILIISDIPVIFPVDICELLLD